MSESFDDGGLTAEELKSHLYQSLHSSGLLKKLKVSLHKVYIINYIKYIKSKWHD